MRKPAFTIIELMIVIAIIGILAAMGTAAFFGSKAKARNSAAKSDVVQLAKAVESFKDSHSEGVMMASDNAPTNLASSTYGGEAISGTSEVGAAGFKTVLFNTAVGYPVTLAETQSNSYTYVYKTSPYDTGGSHAVYNTTGNTSYLICTNQKSVVPGGADQWFYIENNNPRENAAACPAAQ